MRAPDWLSLYQCRHVAMPLLLLNLADYLIKLHDEQRWCSVGGVILSSLLFIINLLAYLLTHHVLVRRFTSLERFI